MQFSLGSLRLEWLVYVVPSLFSLLFVTDM
jgi:hypothetical protein